MCVEIRFSPNFSRLFRSLPSPGRGILCLDARARSDRPRWGCALSNPRCSLPLESDLPRTALRRRQVVTSQKTAIPPKGRLTTLPHVRKGVGLFCGGERRHTRQTEGSAGNDSRLPDPAATHRRRAVHLEQLSVLAQAAKNALSDRDEALGAQIDDRIESEFRLKERAMEALRQHRSEHGC